MSTAAHAVTAVGNDTLTDLYHAETPNIAATQERLELRYVGRAGEPRTASRIQGRWATPKLRGGVSPRAPAGPHSF